MLPDTVTNRITVPQTPERQSLTKIIVLLVVLNLAILTYFLAITSYKPQSVVESEQATPLIAKSNPPLSLANPSTPVKIAPIKQLDEPRNLTSAPDKLAATKKQLTEPVKPIAAPPQPVKKPIPAAIAEPQVPTKPKNVAEQQSIDVPQATVKTDAPPTENPAPVATARPQNDLPTLQDLPANVRQSLPGLPINVFSYSSTPAERFVMIDMVKYVPGQTIKNALELKEIVEDGIIVRYQDQIFKITR